MRVVAAVALFLVAVFSVVVGRLRRRPRRAPNLKGQNEDETNRALRNAQAQWMRDQELLTADSIIASAQKARATIAHAGAVEVRAILDDLQQQAADHPEGVPGHIVAAVRLRFDQLLRENLQ